MRRSFVALAVAGLLVTASGTAAMAGELVLPAVTGASPVGRVELALTDQARTDPFATEVGGPRELAVWIWHPAADDSSGAPAPYLPPTWASLVNGAGVVSQDLNEVRTHSIADAPLTGRPPVLVLLPGLGQPVAAYTALAEDLASHGYAVVAINPTGSALVEFPDGHVVAPTANGNIDPALLADIPGWYEAAARIADVWVADTAFVVTTLAADPPPIGALDFSHVAYVGHSMGGAAAFEACRGDATCAAAVDLDGTLWTDVRHAGLTAPSLVLRHDRTAGCDGFCEAANADFATVEAAGHSQQFSVAGSQHMDFSDLGLLRGPNDTQLPLGPIDSERMTLITRDLVRTFLGEHLGQAPAGTLTDAVARYPEVS